MSKFIAVLALVIFVSTNLYAEEILSASDNIEKNFLSNKLNIINDKKQKIFLHLERNKKLISNVKAAATDSAIVLNTEDTIENAKSKICCIFTGISNSELQPGEKEISVDISGPKNSTAKVLLEGKTINGKHFFKQKTFKFNGNKQTILFTENFNVELKNAHVRVDLLSDGIYTFSKVSYRSLKN